jgi:hypothetical protein
VYELFALYVFIRFDVQLYVQAVVQPGPSVHVLQQVQGHRDQGRRREHVSARQEAIPSLSVTNLLTD